MQYVIKWSNKQITKVIALSSTKYIAIGAGNYWDSYWGMGMWEITIQQFSIKIKGGDWSAQQRCQQDGLNRYSVYLLVYDVDQWNEIKYCAFIFAGINWFYDRT